jgi:hypothetical protein
VYMFNGTSAEPYHRLLEGALDAAIIAQPPIKIPPPPERGHHSSDEQRLYGM